MKMFVVIYFPNKITVTLIQASVYSPYLHDAMYMYALALNRTPVEQWDDGALISANTKGSFLGASKI